MDTVQDLTQTEQTSFENFEKEKSESILAAFFNDCNEEEQKIINEFSQIQGIRANDAVWVFVKIFFGINRANNTLPQRISDALYAKTNEILEAIKQFAASSVENEAQKAMSNLSDSLMKFSQDFLNQQKKVRGFTIFLFLLSARVWEFSFCALFRLLAERLSQEKAGDILP